MEKIGELFKQNRNIGVYFHTHLSENISEVARARELFPERRDYLDIYDYYGLLSNRSISYFLYIDVNEKKNF